MLRMDAIIFMSRIRFISGRQWLFDSSAVCSKAFLWIDSLLFAGKLGKRAFRITVGLSHESIVTFENFRRIRWSDAELGRYGRVPRTWRSLSVRIIFS